MLTSPRRWRRRPETAWDRCRRVYSTLYITNDSHLYLPTRHDQILRMNRCKNEQDIATIRCIIFDYLGQVNFLIFLQTVLEREVMQWLPSVRLSDRLFPLYHSNRLTFSLGLLHVCGSLPWLKGGWNWRSRSRCDRSDLDPQSRTVF